MAETGNETDSESMDRLMTALKEFNKGNVAMAVALDRNGLKSPEAGTALMAEAVYLAKQLQAQGVVTWESVMQEGRFSVDDALEVTYEDAVENGNMNAAEAIRLDAQNRGDVAMLNRIGEGDKTKKAERRLSEAEEKDVRNMFDQCADWNMRWDTKQDNKYYPVMKHIPDFAIDVIGIEDHPVVMQIYKARQAVADEETVFGKSKGHGLSTDDMIDIFKELQTAKDAYFQTRNGRIGFIVPRKDGKTNKTLCVLEFNKDFNKDQMPGFINQRATVAVTVYPFDNMQKYKSYINDKNNIKIPKTKEAILQGGLRSYILAHLNKIASNGTLSQMGEDVNEKFESRLSVDVENAVGELIAVHNTTEENLQRALELGGMPMISVAVIKAKDGHTKYGPYSVIMDKSSIDPEQNSANRVYGANAYTPTKPDIENKLNYDRSSQFNNEIRDLAEKATKGYMNSRSDVLSQYGVYGNKTAKEFNDLVDDLSRNGTVLAAYCADKGIDVELVMEKHDEDTEEARYFIDALGGEEAAQEIIDNIYDGEEYAEKYISVMEQFEREKGTKEKYIGFFAENLRNDVYKVSRELRKYLRLLAQQGTETFNENATVQKLRERVNKADVKAWLRDKMEGVYGEKGIRTGADDYDYNGNLRPFARTHWKYTADNIVRAMSTQQAARGQGAEIYSAEGMASITSREYRNIDEIREDSERLKMLSDEEHKAEGDRIYNDIKGVMDGILQKNGVDYYSGRIMIKDAITDATKTRNVTTAKVANAFAKQGLRLTAQEAQDVLRVMNEAANMNVGYFEAKLNRVFGFDEIKTLIAPADANKALIRQMEDRGVNIVYYETGNDEQRVEIMQQMDDARFSIDDEGWTADDAENIQALVNVGRATHTTIDADGVITDTQGRGVALYEGDGHVRFSLDTYQMEGRDILKKYLDEQVGKKGLSREDADTIMTEMETIYDIANKYRNDYEAFGNWSRAKVVMGKDGAPLLSVVKQNGEYAMNLDFSLVCKKRRTLDAVFNEMIRRNMLEGVIADKSGITEMNRIIKKNGLEVACDLCFVDAKRYRQQKISGDFVNLWNDIVRMFKDKEGHSYSRRYFNFGENEDLAKNAVVFGGRAFADEAKKGEADESAVKARMAELKAQGKQKGVEYGVAGYLLNHPEQRKLLDVGDFMSSNGFTNIRCCCAR